MSAAIPRQKVQMALRIMASKAREAKEVWQLELTACRDKGLIKADNTGPASLTERFAHWSMANLMLHMAVTELLFSGKNGPAVDKYVRDLISGESWPTETE